LSEKDDKRAQPRRKVPSTVALRCEMRIGALSLEAAVVDISLGGIGTLVYDSRVRLAPGMRVESARILHGDNIPVTVELEITNVSPVVDRDGRPANRAGCVIRGSRQTLEELVRMFISDLGEET
jgi:hypothetical protein